MKSPLLLCGVALAAPFMQGCSSVPATQPSRAWRVEPVFTTSDANHPADGHYALGRYYAGMRRWTEAVQSYRKAILASPSHVEAHNALGVALAQQGRYVEALDSLRQAAALAPSRSHVHNNLGRVQMLVGQDREAAVSLKSALLLDRENASARENLRVLLSRMQPQEPPLRAATPPAAPNAVALSAIPVVTSPNTAALPVISPAAAPEAVALPAVGLVAASHAVALPAVAPVTASNAVALPAVAPVAAPNAVALRAVAPAAAPNAATLPGTAPASSSHADADTAPPARPPRIEVSNGNGIAGFAKAVQGWLVQQGWATKRLTNQRPYQQAQTIVHYRQGFEASARRLAKDLPTTVEVGSSNELRSEVDVRIVLGRDARTWAMRASGSRELVVTAVTAR